ncbi:MAG: Uma2 family endonuclease [Acidobacteriota bacterium]|mgnify:CR=1 FL=1
MGTCTLVPVSEYLATSYHPDREYVDGLLVERNVGERDHSRLQILLGTYLCNREKQWNIRAYTEQRVQVSPTRFRVPDICVVAGSEPEEQVFTQPPFICIEILSADDRMDEVQMKIDDYLAFGVRYVWLINPRTRRAFVCTADGMREAKDGILRTQDPEIVVGLSEVLGGR